VNKTLPSVDKIKLFKRVEAGEAVTDVISGISGGSWRIAKRALKIEDLIRKNIGKRLPREENWQ
jgi:hypothetical protein